MYESFDKLRYYWIKFGRKWWRRIALFCAVFLIFFLVFKQSILKGVGNFLIVEDKVSLADALFVLGGNANDRSLKALDLYNQGYTQKIYTLGSNPITDLNSAEYAISEANLSRDFLLLQGLPLECIQAIPKATSTVEESDVILQFAKKNGFKKIIIVSDKFHLRRVGYVFRNKFEAYGIAVQLIGVSNSQYKEESWWKYEQGLIMVNNEYLKLFYYWWNGWLH